VGDLASNLGGYTLDAERDLYPDVDIQAIGDAVVEMVEASMDAYAEEDVAACHAVAERDDEVDDMCERASNTVVRELIGTELDPGNDERDAERFMTDVSRLLLTIRDLERVGDHAVNVAARTLYMVESDDTLLY
jgi:phosphate transport system protein